MGLLKPEETKESHIPISSSPESLSRAASNIPGHPCYDNKTYARVSCANNVAGCRKFRYAAKLHWPQLHPLSEGRESCTSPKLGEKGTLESREESGTGGGMLLEIKRGMDDITNLPG